MIDAKLGVLALPVEEFPEWFKDRFREEGSSDDIHDITFCYHPVADKVVLNKTYKDADFYEMLVTTYLGVDDDTREFLKQEVPFDLIRSAIDLLDTVLERRAHAGSEM